MNSRRAAFVSVALCTASAALAQQQAGAVLIVNSSSPAYADAERYVRPYLDHFGVPYTVLDIATTPVTPDIGAYAVMVIGHGSLDPDHRFLDAAEQADLASAVRQGTGLVNFDADLTADGATPRYPFIQAIFGFGYGSPEYGAGVAFTAEGATHYVSSRHAAGSTVATAWIPHASLSVPATGTVLARVRSTDLPLVTVTSFGEGRAVQWSSYRWMSISSLGPMYGLDDLVWRGLAWAARKPFVMQGLPSFVTMRVDDSNGYDSGNGAYRGFWWVHTANQLSIKPWLGLFYGEISEADAADLSSLVRAGNATASPHARTSSEFVYFDHAAGLDLPDPIVAGNLQDAASWHAAHDIPVSKFVLGHFYELGSNAFPTLQSWGVEFVGTMMSPGSPYYGSPWLNLGPFRRSENALSNEGYPGAYADYLPIPGHPELDGRFFDCVTEIRDDAGYEWYPDGDVAGTIGRGTRQTQRALDAMALATLFTHEYYIQSISATDWQAELSGIAANLAAYDPVYVTMDDACRYLRAKHDTRIVSASFDPTTQTIAADLVGNADVATQLLVFTDAGGSIARTAVPVPAFVGVARVSDALAGPLDHVVVSPAQGQAAAGATLPFAAQGFDAAGHSIAGLTFQWSAASAAGTIDASGLFTAGPSAGVFSGAVSATAGGVTGRASVEVYAQVLDHFGFDAVTGPVFANAPFQVRITAYDQAGNAIPGFRGEAGLADATGTLSPDATGSFSGGAWSGSVTVATATGGDVLTASSGTVVSQSAPFEVQDGSGGALSLWPIAATPGNVDHGPDDPVELGVRFHSDVDGYVTGVRFYKAAANTGRHVGNLWSGGGTLLTSATFTGETGSGWQQVTFPAPVPITAGTIYVASYHTDVGHYSQDIGYFAAAGEDSQPLHAPASGSAGGNGVYAYGPASSFPAGTYAGANYWVDVLFQPGAAPALASLTVSPGGASLVVGGQQTFTASGTFSDGSVQDVSSRVAWSSSAPMVAAAAPGGLVTALSPGGATITATSGGLSATASVAVVAIDRRFDSLFSTSVSPGRADHGADDPVELGVRFTSDVHGYVTGIRFYKAPTNTGTHVAGLWTGSGTLLASTTFSSETASGWQEVLFSTPVAIAAGATYVASYHTEVGHYSQDIGYFASAGEDNPPLHAPSSGTSGGNGLYAYGPAGTFPDGTFAAANYWVDVLFSPGP